MARGPGRPNKIDDETKAALLGVIRIGGTLKDACHAANIDYSTFARWMQKGEAASSGEYYDFRNLVIKAKTSGKVRHLKNLSDAGEVDWRASLEWLKRMYRSEWGDSISIRKEELQNLSDEELERIVNGGDG